MVSAKPKPTLVPQKRRHDTGKFFEQFFRLVITLSERDTWWLVSGWPVPGHQPLAPPGTTLTSWLVHLRQDGGKMNHESRTCHQNWDHNENRQRSHQRSLAQRSTVRSSKAIYITDLNSRAVSCQNEILGNFFLFSLRKYFKIQTLGVRENPQIG